MLKDFEIDGLWWIPPLLVFSTNNENKHLKIFRYSNFLHRYQSYGSNISIILTP
jgi:hypothetical protein